MAEARIFGAFERAVAARYLRARKGERAVSLIAAFSLAGIALGVATLIVVLSVMGGFRQELLARILGLNGNLGVVAADGPLRDYEAVAARIRALPQVAQAMPTVEGQVLLTTDAGASAGGLVRLPRMVPYRLALELALTGEMIPASRAYELGLLNRIVPAGEALEGALALARSIVANGPLAVATSKRVMRDSAGWSDAEIWPKQNAATAAIFDSEDAREGAAAFAEKRAPVWKGK
ncbi:MAG TPA: enoyl-CoA hydratase-related protein [Pseudomonadales bacterium]|nr:enoyl-CoA hydratase-related protein [Pseudomonadales bacterium]